MCSVLEAVGILATAAATAKSRTAAFGCLQLLHAGKARCAQCVDVVLQADDVLTCMWRITFTLAPVFMKAIVGSCANAAGG